MARIAIIIDGRVDNVVLAPEDWEQEGALCIASETANPGDLYDADIGEFTAPPADPVYRDADAARTALYDAIDTFTASITGRVPNDEKLSWISKEDAARAVESGDPTAAQIALLFGEASLTGETVEQLAALIISNADQYRSIIAMLTGLRRVAEATINDATDPYEYEAIIANVIDTIGRIND